MYMDIMYRGGYSDSDYAGYERMREEVEDFWSELDEEEMDELYREIA